MTRLYQIFRQHPTISTDSRQIAPDSIFFALRGANFDGNQFAREALKKGAAYAVIDDSRVLEEALKEESTTAVSSESQTFTATAKQLEPEVKEVIEEIQDIATKINEAHAEERRREEVRLILVDDVLKALQDLAREHRRALDIPILAISGSNGKTTTKELINRVLSAHFRTYATRGNLNNHIGVPLTLLAMDSKTQFGIVEMGASAQGEIALLASIAEPDYGILTNVGRAHLGGFGGPEGVRKGKGELYDFLMRHSGKAFVREDDAVLTSMADERPALDTVRYSSALAEGVKSHLEGDYNRFNIAAAVAVGREFGIGEEEIRTAVWSYIPDNNRSQRMETARNTLIVDCYNANPSSMRASLQNFLEEDLSNRTHRVMILGDMLELGDWSLKEHAEMITLAASDNKAELKLVGKEFAAAYESLTENPGHCTLYPSRKELLEALGKEPITNALVLIKGSRGIGLEHAIEAL